MEKISVLPPHELINQQLQQILNQAEFIRSSTLTRLLEFLVNTKLSGHESEINDYTVGVRVLGQPPNFNPLCNHVVKTHTSRLRNLLRHYYEAKRRNDVILISLPRETYIPVFLDTTKQVAGSLLAAG
jgi:hypothetical protein